MGADEVKRTYLVVVDDSAEAAVALRFAARRAAKTNGRIEVLGVVEPQDFVQFGGVQAAIEEEQRLRIEGVVSASVGEILNEAGIEATIIVQHGEPVKAVRDYVGEREEVAALVLGAAPSGNPGPLVSNFCGNDAGKLPCPIMLIPGSLTDERLEQLS
jgi:nucleotide-binding universal stress UspA family protein